MPQPKTRPDSPVPSLQGPCDRSLKSDPLLPVSLMLEKEMATYSSIPAWRIPWTEEPGGLQSLELDAT